MKTGGRRFRKRGVIFYIGNILSAHLKALSDPESDNIRVDDDKSLSLERRHLHPLVIADGNLYAGCNIQHQNIGWIKLYLYLLDVGEDFIPS